MNLTFTAVFIVELAINAFAHWFWPFVTDGWSQVDAFVVVMSIVPMLIQEQKTGIVRILRAFRILRLFRRVPSLRKIISALTKALLPVINVFCILLLLIGICKRDKTLSCDSEVYADVSICRGGRCSIRVQEFRSG